MVGRIGLGPLDLVSSLHAAFGYWAGVLDPKRQGLQDGCRSCSCGGSKSNRGCHWRSVLPVMLLCTTLAGKRLVSLGGCAVQEPVCAACLPASCWPRSTQIMQPRCVSRSLQAQVRLPTLCQLALSLNQDLIHVAMAVHFQPTCPHAQQQPTLNPNPTFRIWKSLKPPSMQ